MTNLHKIFALGMTAVIVLGAFILFQENEAPSTSVTIDEPNEVAVSDISIDAPINSPIIVNEEAQQVIEGWKEFASAEYSLQYPTEATINDRESDLIITFMGQKQIDSGRTQTELFDGYAVRIGKIIDPQITNLQELAEQERTNAVQHCMDQGGVVSEISQVSLSNKTGYQYTAEGCRVDYTETIISDSNTIYRISQSYFGDDTDQPKYKNITDTIFNSITFN